jgi:hypothetical protein
MPAAAGGLAVAVPWDCGQCGHHWEPLAVHQQRVRCPACRHQQRVRVPGAARLRPGRPPAPGAAGKPRSRAAPSPPASRPARRPAGARAPVAAAPPAAAAGLPQRGRAVPVSRAEAACVECRAPASVRLRFHHPHGAQPGMPATGLEADCCARHEKAAEAVWMRRVGPLGAVQPVLRYQ